MKDLIKRYRKIFKDDPDVMKSKKLLDDFTKYCEQRPELRFWQALRNWCGYHYIIARNTDGRGEMSSEKDTFYWEDRNG